MTELAFTRASVVAPEAATSWYEGTGVCESVMGVVDGFSKGDWLGMGGNLLSTGLSAIGAVMDPFQAIFAAGVGWLLHRMSHDSRARRVRPLPRRRLPCRSPTVPDGSLQRVRSRLGRRWTGTCP